MFFTGFVEFGVLKSKFRSDGSVVDQWEDRSEIVVNQSLPNPPNFPKDGGKIVTDGGKRFSRSEKK